MTEEEAAAKLRDLLNEIQVAGHEVAVGSSLLWVGETVLHEPTFSDGEWAVEAE